MNSRAKGQRGERQWSAWLREHGYPEARRGVQYQGGPGSPDVVNGIPGTHCEVKLVEHLHLYPAMRQAVDDSGEAVPYVAHRRNYKPWLVTVRAEDLVRFARCVLGLGGKMTEDELMEATNHAQTEQD